VGGPNGELDWMTAPSDANQLRYLQELTGSMDTILMGRKMTAGFTRYWENVVDTQPDSPEHPYAKIFVDTPKIVFSKTVSSVPGRNTKIENGDLQEAVNQLKAQKGKDIIVYGGANFVLELITHQLIDDLFLFVNPVAIGNGLKIFPGRFSFNLVKAEAFSNGVVLHHYQPKK